MAVGTVRVLLADCCEEARSQCRVILRSAAGFDVVAEAADWQTAQELNRVFRPGLILLDLGLAGPEIRAALHELRDENPAVRIVVLNGQEDGVMITRLLQWGATGYVRTADVEQELLPALQMVKRGGVWIDAALLSLMVAGCTEDEPGSGALGPDEQTVLELARHGASSEQIARQLNISARTVRGRLRRIHDRLGESTRIVAAMWAFELDLNGGLPPLNQPTAPQPAGRPCRNRDATRAQMVAAPAGHARPVAKLAKERNAPKRSA